MKKIAVLITVLFIGALSGFSQKKENSFTTKSKKAIAFYQESEMFMVRRQYHEAINLLNNAIEKDENFLEAHLRLANIRKRIGQNKEAKVAYEFIVSKSPNDKKFSDAYLNLAEIEVSKGQYGIAEELLSKYRNFAIKDPEKSKKANRMLSSIIYTKKNINNPLPFKPVPLPEQVNKLVLQYFPVLTADGNSLVFTGRVNLSPNSDEDLYICTKDNDGKWSEPVTISENINTRNNEGTATISADGRTIIFTSCLGRKGYGSCDLFVSYKKGEEWTKPENLGPNINSRAWESQPSLSADGRKLYFVSDRRGGLGRRDIYVSELKEKEWSAPKNLGAPINTEDDEVSPFMHANGETLYFGSNGHLGFGNFDIFKSELEEKSWSDPKNLGYPINTFEDQVSLFVTADGKKGYYANENMNTKNRVKSALYEFDIPEEAQVKNRSNYVSGRVFDKETGVLIGAKIQLFDLQADKLKLEVEADNISGEYLMVLTQGAAYALYINKKGYLFHSLSFDYQETKDLKPIKIDIYLEPIKKGKATVLNNIFFDVDKYEVIKKSKTELEHIKSFLNENPSVNIGIGGHTDNTGSEVHNKKLSVNRAKSVYEYLVGIGVAANRLKYRGFGQEKPIAENDTDENKQKNRRIEFTIL